MTSYSLIAADPPKDPAKKPSGPDSILGNPLFFFFIIIVMMYFLLIRPQSKARREQQARVAALKKGDKVVSIGGLHGIVHHISERTVTLKLAEGVFVPFEKSAIQTVQKVRKDDGKGGDGKGEDKEDEKK